MATYKESMKLTVEDQASGALAKIQKSLDAVLKSSQALQKAGSKKQGFGELNASFQNILNNTTKLEKSLKLISNTLNNNISTKSSESIRKYSKDLAELHKQINTLRKIPASNRVNLFTKMGNELNHISKNADKATSSILKLMQTFSKNPISNRVITRMRQYNRELLDMGYDAKIASSAQWQLRKSMRNMRGIAGVDEARDGYYSVRGRHKKPISNFEAVVAGSMFGIGKYAVYDVAHELKHSVGSDLAFTDALKQFGFNKSDRLDIRNMVYAERRKNNFAIPSTVYRELVQDLGLYIRRHKAETPGLLNQASSVIDAYMNTGLTAHEATKRYYSAVKMFDQTGYSKFIGTSEGSKFMNAMTLVSTTLRNTLTPGAAVTTIRNLKSSGVGLSDVGLASVLGLADTVGAKAGTYLNNVESVLTSNFINKRTMHVQKVLGLRDEHNKSTPIINGMHEDPVGWIIKNVPVLLERLHKVKGHSNDSVKDLALYLTGGQKLASAAISETYAAKFNIDRVKQVVMDANSGFVNPKQITNESVVNQLGSIKDSLVDIVSSLTRGTLQGFAPTIRSVRNWLGNIDSDASGFAQTLASAHPATLAGGAIAAAKVTHSIFERITGFKDLKVASVNLNEASNELRAAARTMGLGGGGGGGSGNVIGTMEKTEEDILAKSKKSGIFKRAIAGLGKLRGKTLTGLALGLGVGSTLNKAATLDEDILTNTASTLEAGAVKGGEGFGLHSLASLGKKGLKGLGRLGLSVINPKNWWKLGKKGIKLLSPMGLVAAGGGLLAANLDKGTNSNFDVSMRGLAALSDVGGDAAMFGLAGAAAGSVIPGVGTAVGGAIGTIGGAAYGLYKNGGTIWNGIKAAASSAWNTISSTSWDDIKGLFNKLIEVLENLPTMLQHHLSGSGGDAPVVSVHRGVTPNWYLPQHQPIKASTLPGH